MSSTLRLVKHKVWYIPGNSQTYKMLTELGFPTTRIHEDSLGILKLLLKKNGIQARVTPFAQITDTFYDKAYEWWASKGGKSTFKDSAFSFRCDSNASGIKYAETMKSKLEEFRDRWGLQGEVVLSELNSKLKVYFKLSATVRFPVMKLKVKAEREKHAILELGNFRIATSTDSKFFVWRVDSKAGSEWKMHMNGKCLLNEVSHPRDFISNLMIAFQTD